MKLKRIKKKLIDKKKEFPKFNLGSYQVPKILPSMVNSEEILGRTYQDRHTEQRFTLTILPRWAQEPTSVNKRVFRKINQDH